MSASLFLSNIVKTNLNHLVPTPKKQSEYKQMFGDDDEEEDYYITKEVVGVAKHFLDGNPKFRPYAQWAVAVVLSKSRHHQEALARYVDWRKVFIGF